MIQLELGRNPRSAVFRIRCGNESLVYEQLERNLSGRKSKITEDKNVEKKTVENNLNKDEINKNKLEKKDKEQKNEKITEEIKKKNQGEIKK